jgi:cytochrome d ubiquinol oxidase subunit II
MLPELVAFILFVGVVLYACFGGADFGVGIWDLTAGSAKRGGSMRSLIDHSIGPVWEANHVWLIFVLVYLWSGFPTAFASVMETLWIPFSLAGLGIVFRGAAFAFRKFSPTLEFARIYGALFAVSSVLTPFFFGAIAGALASGRVPATGVGDAWRSWTQPASLIGGVLAVLTCAFLAAVFLTYEASRRNDSALVEAFRRRALCAGAVTGTCVLLFLFPLRNDAPDLFDRLLGRGFPFVIVCSIAGTLALVALLLRHLSIARVAAVVAVACVILGWGFAQYPWISMNELHIDDTAGASATLVSLVVVFGLAAVTVVPALAYLYWVTQRPSWSAEDH